MVLLLFLLSFRLAYSLEFESDRLKINNKQGRVVLTGNVKAWNDTGTIKANRLIIRYVAGGDTVLSYEAFGQVRMDYRNLKARSEYAYRDARADTLSLQEDAYVKRSDNEFWADRMTVNLRTSRVQMAGSVRGTVRSGTRPSLSGES